MPDNDTTKYITVHGSLPRLFTGTIPERLYNLTLTLTMQGTPATQEATLDWFEVVGADRLTARKAITRLRKSGAIAKINGKLVVTADSLPDLDAPKYEHGVKLLYLMLNKGRQGSYRPTNERLVLRSREKAARDQLLDLTIPMTAEVFRWLRDRRVIERASQWEDQYPALVEPATVDRLAEKLDADESTLRKLAVGVAMAIVCARDATQTIHNPAGYIVATIKQLSRNADIRDSKQLAQVVDSLFDDEGNTTWRRPAFWAAKEEK